MICKLVLIRVSLGYWVWCKRDWGLVLDVLGAWVVAKC